MLTLRYCVAACPTLVAGVIPATWPIYDSASAVLTFGITVTASGTSAAFTSTDKIGYDSFVAFDRVCLPTTTVFQNAFSACSSAFNSLLQGDLANFITDVKNNWQWLLAAVGFCVIVSFVFMFLLRCLAGCIVWLSIFGIIMFFGLTGVVFLYNYGMIPSLGTYVGQFNIPSTSAGGQKYYDIYGYICFGISGLFLILTLCCCSRIRLAVAVCKSAGHFVAGVCQIILVPIFQASLLISFWGACLVVMVFLISTATFVIANGSSDYFTSV
jgi:hypothetical protein